MRIKEKNIYNLEKEKKDINNNKKKPPPKKNRYENYRTLIARQDDYVRKHDVNGWEKYVKDAKWWLPISRDREQRSPFTHAIRRSISTPSVHENNLRTSPAIKKNGYMYSHDSTNRYDTSDFGKLEQHAKHIPFHCLSHQAIKTATQLERTVGSDDAKEKMYYVMGKRKTYFDDIIETSKKRPSSVSYDNYWERMGTMVSGQDLQAFTPIQENFAIIKNKDEIEKIRNSKTRRMDWIGDNSLEPTPGPGKYEIKTPESRGGRMRKILPWQ